MTSGTSTLAIAVPAGDATLGRFKAPDKVLSAADTVDAALLAAEALALNKLLAPAASVVNKAAFGTAEGRCAASSLCVASAWDAACAWDSASVDDAAARVDCVACADGNADDCADPCAFSPAGVACRVSLLSPVALWCCDAAAPGVASVGVCVVGPSRESSSERERSGVVAATVAATAANRPVLAIAALAIAVPIDSCVAMDAAGGASAATGIDGNVADAVLIEPDRKASGAEIFSASLFKLFASGATLVLSMAEALIVASKAVVVMAAAPRFTASRLTEAALAVPTLAVPALAVPAWVAMTPAASAPIARVLVGLTA